MGEGSPEGAHLSNVVRAKAEGNGSFNTGERGDVKSEARTTGTWVGGSGAVSENDNRVKRRGSGQGLDRLLA